MENITRTWFVVARVAAKVKIIKKKYYCGQYLHLGLLRLISAVVLISILPSIQLITMCVALKPDCEISQLFIFPVSSFSFTRHFSTMSPFWAAKHNRKHTVRKSQPSLNNTHQAAFLARKKEDQEAIWLQCFCRETKPYAVFSSWWWKSGQGQINVS